jgi:hypothetical protein
MPQANSQDVVDIPTTLIEKIEKVGRAKSGKNYGIEVTCKVVVLLRFS